MISLKTMFNFGHLQNYKITEFKKFKLVMVGNIQAIRKREILYLFCIYFVFINVCNLK